MSAATFRTAGIADVETMLEWAAREGWNPGEEDAAAFHAADPEGFLLAEVGGTLAAAISVVNHSDEFAFLGFYICRPEFRGRGIGFALWRHALAHAGNRTVGLDGVADQEANYRRSGFERAGASVRYEGRLTAKPEAAVRGIRPTDAAAIAALDMAANGVQRPAFLSAWTADTPTRKTLVLDGPNGPRGYATIRRCREGVKVGPIVAEGADDAIALAQAALDVLPAETAVIDIPSSNDALRQRLVARGFRDTFATARMYRGTPPTTLPLLQAIGTMELG
ncbi:GNAT family N-acetyltransferase [Tropicimonas marinistellae]|uniref:GNAT family N-acetyltransferase n=1 Tax=Tropicimonas marinistellae TaxID=1739787 RepID=UPI00082BE455|nr:GNAT family N-acetyltransferase [Tropicimonas marinistellae]